MYKFKKHLDINSFLLNLNLNLQKKKSMLVVIIGGSGSGKTSVANAIRNASENSKEISVISIDNYYKSLSENIDINNYNFDDYDAFDWDLLQQHINKLLTGETIEMPQYSFITHKRLPETVSVKTNKIILEGIMVSDNILNSANIKIFIDVNSDIRLGRRIERDLIDRKGVVTFTIQQWNKFVEPVFAKLIYPLRSICDFIIPRGVENIIAINIIAKNI